MAEKQKSKHFKLKFNHMREIKLKITSTRVVSIVIVFVLFLMNGCQQDDFYNTNEEMTYLSLTSKRPFETPRDLETIGQALKRINIFYKNGLLEIKQTSAKEINVSDELFGFLINTINHTNNVVLSKELKPSFPRLKTGEEESPPSENSSGYDCVANTIFAISNSLGGNYTLEDINNWLSDEYEDYEENGVWYENLDAIIDHFFGSSEYQPGPPVYYNIGDAGNTRTIAILDFWDGTGHAGTLMWSDGLNALINDDQNGGTIYCEAWRIRCTYKVEF